MWDVVVGVEPVGMPGTTVRGIFGGAVWSCHDGIRGGVSVDVGDVVGWVQGWQLWEDVQCLQKITTSLLSPANLAASPLNPDLAGLAVTGFT